MLASYHDRSAAYPLLALDHAKLSSLYTALCSPQPSSTFFLAFFRGKGWPSDFHGNSFVFRGRPWEQLAEFCNRLGRMFPGCSLSPSGHGQGHCAIEVTALHSEAYSTLCVGSESPEDPMVAARFFDSLADHPSRDSAISQVRDHRWFSHLRAFQKEFFPREGGESSPVLDHWTERTLYVTEESLPSCLPFSKGTSSMVDFPDTDLLTVFCGRSHWHP